MGISNSVSRARPLLGTFVEISAGGASRVAVEAAVDRAFAAVEQIHRLMSFHDPASDVGRLNREAASRAVTVHSLTSAVLEAALDLHRRSSGVFDITVAPLLQERGLLPKHDGRPPHRPAAAARGVAIELLSGQRVCYAHPGVAIDLGGIAKGFAVDRAIAALRESGVTHGVVNAGGDLFAFGTPVAVDLRDPRDFGRTLCRVTLHDEALASSGGRFDPLAATAPATSAVINPATGRAAVVAGASVAAPTCMIADALTKVVMIAGEAAGPLLDHFRARALMVAADGTVNATSDWRVDLAA